MCPNNADGMANSVDPDQTALLEAFWSGSIQFAQTCLSRCRNITVYQAAKLVIVIKLLTFRHLLKTAQYQ